MTQITAAQAAILAINSLALGGLLFLLSSGFSLIFGLMRIPNLMHGSFFMLGAYFGVTLLGWGTNFWLAAVLSGLGVAAIGGVIERFLLRRLEGQVLPQVSADARLRLHHRRCLPDDLDRRSLAALGSRELRGAVQAFGMFFPLYRLAILASRS
jgi:branched-chain amino acid transport system permease protein